MLFLDEKPMATEAQLTEAAEMEQQAALRDARKEASFESCDTDGFLSQWASGISADLYRRKATVLRNGGYAQFPVLCDENGVVVATERRSFPVKDCPWIMNRVWKVESEHVDRLGRRWIPTESYNGKSRIQKALKLSETMKWFPADAKITVAAGAKSTGLSGCANAFVDVFKKQKSGDE